MLELCQSDEDLKELRSELMEQGYLRFRKTQKNTKKRLSKPIHFVSSDGFDIYVGKNNNQNDQLTLKTATNNDLWLHTKDIPGSHVIIKSTGKDIPEQTCRRSKAC